MAALAIFAAVMVVIGIYSAKKARTIDGFLLGGTTAVAIGKTFALRSGYIYVTITVTDLVKAS